MIRFSLRKRLHTVEGDVDLEAEMELAPGEFAALSGPSGAGKTTLLRLLAGLARPDAGRIEAFGETWYDSRAGICLPPQRRRAGLVFQDAALFPHLDVRGNLLFALPRRDAEGLARVDALLDAFRLAPLAARRPDTLSGGQRQRVAVARALAANPRALLLDEPFSALDAPARRELQDELAAAQRRFGVAALLVSHDAAEIFRLAARVFRLERGRIVRAGTPGEVLGAGLPGGKFRFAGVLLEKRPADVVVVLTVLVGGEVVKVTVLPEEASGYEPGDRLLLASEAFNPQIAKLDGDGK